MPTRFANSERFVVPQALPRWLAPVALGLVLICALVYGVIEITQAPRAVEAPGFLTPLEDREMQIAAYIPRSHPELAVSGVRATVIFPDGSRRPAVIDGSHQGADALPNREMLGDAQLGTLVRMQFVGGRNTAEPLVEGLPVKLRFEPPRQR